MNTATLESQLAVLRDATTQHGPELAQLHERLFAELYQSKLGRVPAAGERAPDFDLRIARDDRGVRLSSQLELGPVVVAFYRGHWCPFSNVQLKGLQAAHAAIRSLGAEVLFVGPETQANAMKMSEKWVTEIPVLNDSDGLAMEAWNLAYEIPDYLRNDYVSLGFPDVNPATAWRLPIPATFVIDRMGVIRARHVEPDYTRRMEPSDIIAALKKINSR